MYADCSNAVCRQPAAVTALGPAAGGTVRRGGVLGPVRQAGRPKETRQKEGGQESQETGGFRLVGTHYAMSFVWMSFPVSHWMIFIADGGRNVREVSMSISRDNGAARHESA